MQVSPVPILVIDDDPDLREVLSCVLSARGFSVAVASDGQEALRVIMVGKLRPAVVLLDLSMPTLDGEGFLRHARDHLAGVPVVILSAELGRAAAISASVFAILGKPAPLDELLAILRRATQVGLARAHQPAA